MTLMTFSLDKNTYVCDAYYVYCMGIQRFVKRL